MKESVFSPNQETKVDLRQPIDYELERYQKKEVMDKNDIYLEEIRAIDVLTKRFQALADDPEEFKMFCWLYHIDDGLASDFKSVLPAIIGELNRSLGEIFKSKIPLDDYEESLYSILTEDAKTALKKDEYGQVLNAIIEDEVKFAIQILQESRKRPILAHRVRGFGKDEASKEALENALRENISELEFDVRVSKDGQIVIHHNVTLGVSAGKVETIKDLNWDQLEKVELKNGEHLTTLDAFFETIDKIGNKVTKINIDIKDFDREMLDKMLNLIREHHFEHRVNIVSWFPQTLQYLYEKEPNLCYSMSYFPQVRNISRLIMKQVERNDSLSPLLGKIGTWFAKKRAEALRRGTAGAQSYSSEAITSTRVVDSNEPWSDVYGKGKPTKGIHEFSYGPLPIDDEDGNATIMSRVLHNGSINIMAFEEMMASFIDKVPLLSKHKAKIINLFNRTNALKKLIKKCATNGVAVNLYDLFEKSDIETYFDFYEGVELGPNVKRVRSTIYSSNKDAVERLDTRINV